MDFSFDNDVTPLSDPNLIWIAPFVYLTLLWGLKRFVRECTAGSIGYDLRWWVIVHNASLSIISGMLFVPLVYEIVMMFVESDGLFSVVCDHNGRLTGRPLMMYCLYINYLLKYVELGDTMLLALRGKPTPFLHVYHHGITLVLCLTQLRGQTTMQWAVVSINLFVHVIMYAFYALHMIGGYNLWWKRYLTLLQIAQFVFVVILCGAGYVYSRLIHWGYILVDNPCRGDPTSQTFGVCVLISYLVLFLRFYDETYSRTKKVK